MSYKRTFCRSMVALTAPGLILAATSRSFGQSSTSEPLSVSKLSVLQSSSTNEDSLTRRILRGNWERTFGAQTPDAGSVARQGSLISRYALMAYREPLRRLSGLRDLERPGADLRILEDESDRAGGAGQQQSSPPIPALVGLGLSRIGATGLVRVPTAAVTLDGDVILAGFPHTRKGTQGKQYQLPGDTTTVALSLGFLPHTEIGIGLGDDSQAKDLTANAKWQFRQETGRLPALAIGVAELNKLGGSTASGKYPANYYGVASKSFLNGELNVSAGLKDQKDFRAFGGVEAGLGKFASAMVEADGHTVNFGLRTSVAHDHIQGSIHYVDGGFTVQGAVRFTIRTGGRGSVPTAVTLAQPGAELSDTDAAKAIQTRLIDLGLENVEVRIASGDNAGLQAVYENRSYPHNEMDALSNVLATMAAYAPRHVTSLSVVIKRSDIPVLHVACPLSDYRDFLSGQMDEKTFADRFDVDHETASPLFTTTGNVGADTGVGARSFGRSDLFVYPALRTEIGTETSMARLGLSARPELKTPLTHGINLDVRADIPVAGPLRPSSTTIDRALVDVATKAGSNFLGEAAFGHFPNSRDGGYAEGVWISDTAPVLVRASLGILSRSDGFQQNPTYLLEGRYYLPYPDVNLGILGGKYVDGDTGVTLRALRHFGNTDIGFEYRDTSRSRTGVVTLSLPLGPDHLGYRPSALRIRPGDFFEYQQVNSLQRPNYLPPALVTGNELNVGNNAIRSLLDRDRLNRAYLLRSLALLRHIRPLKP